ncbi:ubiquinol-cytochrome c reductase iron-sulfur subunit [Candidatus Sumerlaeota bacterium]
MKKVSRRTFVMGGALTTAAAVTTGIFLCSGSGCSTLTGIGDTPALAADAYKIEAGGRLIIDLCKTAELNKQHGSVKIIDNALKDPLIVARTGESAFVVASLKCTHRGVEVEYNEKKRCFKCASLGGSEFKMTGEKIKGFAKGPLQSYLARVEGDRLVVEARTP